MAFPQFDLARALRCPATDDEGFQCRLAPSHAGAHRWGRCAATDRGGHRCMLPPGHPGNHEPPWYDRAATAGDRRTFRLRGTEAATESLAERLALACGRYGWAARSSTFTRSWPWSRPGLARWSGMVAPRGVRTVIFEFGPVPPSEPARR